MTDILESPSPNTDPTPQCHYFVVRKKRLCRMTVRPGRQYCGEHEPKPVTDDGKDDTRIPCPYDPKHTCYASKLEKHLSICNAKQTKLPDYVIQNINAPADIDACIRKPLSEIPKATLMKVIDKVSSLYEKYIEGNIAEVPERPIHAAVMEEFCEGDRTESSRRHMRQASSILHLAEKSGLVQDRTCYVELGAGKGQLSYYMGTAWCDDLTASSVVVIDRAALRHKRDNKLRSIVTRIRADLADLALARVDRVEEAKAVVGFAKHLCGVATDYALRCVTADSVLPRTRGIVLATCCHHRCEHAGYIANKHLQELGITGEDLIAMLGIVSWATCGDGRSRERRRQIAEQNNSNGQTNIQQNSDSIEISEQSIQENLDSAEDDSDKNKFCDPKWREFVGRRAKALLDWGRVLYLREKGFDARLCHYVPASVSLENVCIVATKPGR